MPDFSASACVHWWIVEEPHGEPTVQGVCKKCQQVKQFRIWDPAFDRLRESINPWSELRNIEH